MKEHEGERKKLTKERKGKRRNEEIPEDERHGGEGKREKQLLERK